MNCNYLSLRYFLEIAHYLNFSHAAEKLYVSQPGLSQQIKTLEQELGIKLFIRSTRNVTLTEEGEYFYRNLLPLFENIDSIIMELKEVGMVPKKTIRIATIPSAASYLVPILIKRLQEKYPDISFCIKETTSINCIELVQKSEYHLAFIRVPIGNKVVTQRPLRCLELKKYPLQVAVSSQHQAAQKQEIDLRELKDEKFLHYDPKQAPSLYYLLELACFIAGFIPKTIGAGPELLTRANLISNGIGISLMSQDMLNLLVPFNIKGINLKNIPLTSSISVIWNNMNVTAIIEDAIDILEDSKQKM